MRFLAIKHVVVEGSHLEATLGTTGCDDLKQAISAQLPVMNAEARLLFNNFLRVIELRISQLQALGVSNA